MTQANGKPVLIVGAGPTGMTAAMELARFGVPIRLVEKMLEPASTSRAIGVQARTLELFEQRGLAEPMLQAGNRAIAGVIHGGGHVVTRIDFAHIPSRYPFLLIISQAETERIMRAELARQGVTIERGVELVALAQTDPHDSLRPEGGVTAVLRHPDGTLEAVEAAYLISAEGAHSVVRASLGLPFAGHAFEEGYALGDFTLDGAIPDDAMQIFGSDAGFMALFPLGQRHFRLIVSNPQGDPKRGSKPTLAELQAVYDARSEIPARFADLTWSSWFRINSRMVERLQHGRFFLGGDSAHIHSPAGGQGMNTGIQDMINLTWKLALVLRGKAAPELLATYGADRLPVIHDVLQRTEALTKAIGAKNPLLRSVFNAVAPFVVGTEYVQDTAAATISQVALHYRTSELSTTQAHHGHLRAGDRIPDLSLHRVGSGGPPEATRLFPLLDLTRFTLLVANPAPGQDPIPPAVQPWKDLIQIYQVTPMTGLADQEHFTATFGSQPALVLIRPDSYVGFLGDATSGDALIKYLKRWLPLAAAH